MKHFGFYMHFLGDNASQSDLELFFQKLERKIIMFEMNAEKTTELYRKEYKEDLEKAKSQYESDCEEAQIIYKEVKEEYDGHEDASQIAEDASGIMHIQFEYEKLKPFILDTYISMSDNYNKSSLTVLYALIETETNKICSLLKIRYSKLLDHNALSGSDYIMKYLKYIKLVIEIDVTELELFVEANIKSLKLIRNKIIHHDSEFPEESAELRRIIDSSEGMITRIEGPGTFQIKINKIDYVLNTSKLVRMFYQRMFWILEKETNYEIFTNRLKKLFSALTSDIAVNVVSVTSIRKGYRIDAVLESGTIDKLCCNCRVTITISARNQISIANQLDDYPNLTHFEEFLKENSSYVFSDVLQGANLVQRCQDVRIILSP